MDILPKVAKAETPEKNPSVSPATRVTEATRVSMSTKELRLAVPEIPGYHLHWMHARNLGKALRAGYEYVGPEEVEVNNFDVAGDRGVSGSTDLGSRVSVSAGDDAESGRLYLMKLRQEWWDADLAKVDEANEKIAARIRGGNVGDSSADHKDHKYLKDGQKLFYPKDKR